MVITEDFDSLDACSIQARAVCSCFVNTFREPICMSRLKGISMFPDRHISFFIHDDKLLLVMRGNRDK